VEEYPTKASAHKACEFSTLDNQPGNQNTENHRGTGDPFHRERIANKGPYTQEVYEGTSQSGSFLHEITRLLMQIADTRISAGSSRALSQRSSANCPVHACVNGEVP
jgi:hypothetical protein